MSRLTFFLDHDKDHQSPAPLVSSPINQNSPKSSPPASLVTGTLSGLSYPQSYESPLPKLAESPEEMTSSNHFTFRPELSPESGHPQQPEQFKLDKIRSSPAKRLTLNIEAIEGGNIGNFDLDSVGDDVDEFPIQEVGKTPNNYSNGIHTLTEVRETNTPRGSFIVATGFDRFQTATNGLIDSRGMIGPNSAGLYVNTTVRSSPKKMTVPDDGKNSLMDIAKYSRYRAQSEKKTPREHKELLMDAHAYVSLREIVEEKDKEKKALLDIKILKVLVEFLECFEILSLKEIFAEYRKEKIYKRIFKQRMEVLILKGLDNKEQYYYWNSICRFRDLRANHPHAFTSKFVKPVPYLKSIKQDLDRTLPEYDKYSKPEGQAALLKVLTAVSNAIESVGYMQGLNSIAGAFLFYLREEDSFWMTIYFLEKLGIKDILNEDFEKVKLLSFQLQAFLNHYIPDLMQYMEQTSVELSMIVVPWFITLFSHFLSLPDTIKAWNLFIKKGEKFLIQFSLAVFSRYKDRIMSTNQDDISSFFKYDLSDLTRSDPLLFEEFYKFPIKKHHLKELEELHTISYNKLVFYQAEDTTFHWKVLPMLTLTHDLSKNSMDSYLETQQKSGGNTPVSSVELVAEPQKKASSLIDRIGNGFRNMFTRGSKTTKNTTTKDSEKEKKELKEKEKAAKEAEKAKAKEKEKEKQKEKEKEKAKLKEKEKEIVIKNLDQKVPEIKIVQPQLNSSMTESVKEYAASNTERGLPSLIDNGAFREKAVFSRNLDDISGKSSMNRIPSITQDQTVSRYHSDSTAYNRGAESPFFRDLGSKIPGLTIKVGQVSTSTDNTYNEGLDSFPNSQVSSPERPMRGSHDNNNNNQFRLVEVQEDSRDMGGSYHEVHSRSMPENKYGEVLNENSWDGQRNSNRGHSYPNEIDPYKGYGGQSANNSMSSNNVSGSYINTYGQQVRSTDYHNLGHNNYNSNNNTYQQTSPALPYNSYGNSYGQNDQLNQSYEQNYQNTQNNNYTNGGLINSARSVGNQSDYSVDKVKGGLFNLDTQVHSRKEKEGDPGSPSWDFASPSRFSTEGGREKGVYTYETEQQNNVNNSYNQGYAKTYY